MAFAEDRKTVVTVTDNAGGIPEAIISKIFDIYFTGVQGSFNMACRKAGIKDFHFHDLRHTFASQAVMNGAYLASLQKVLGHANLTMTMRYSHLSKDHLSKTVDIIENLFRNPLHDSLHDNQEN